MTIAQQRHRTHKLAIVVGGLLPLAIALVATALMVTWLPELPDPIAIHWSGLSPDGYGPSVPMIFLPLGVVVAYCVFAVGVSWSTTPSGLPHGNQKFMLVTGVWLSTLLSVGIGGSVAMQRGLDDAREADGIGGVLIWGAVLGIILAVAAWFLMPQTGKLEGEASGAEPIELAESEQVSWFGAVRLARAALVVIGAAVLFSLGAVVMVIAAAAEAGGFAIASFVVVLLLALFTASWRLSVDRRGLRVSGAFGWPRVVIPLDEIREVHAIQVDPTAEFGGWGWRWDGAGRSGIIMRRGPAIQVTRASGKRFVVTVDDAATAASVLAALAGARHS